MPANPPLHLRIFISSPGDVGDERKAAREIIESLPRDPAYRGKITSEAIAYDDPDAPSPMPAGITPQLGVNYYKGPASACDLTIVILWSRLGTPVSADCLRSDGSRYESGTVSEYENALAAGKEVWVFRRTEKPRVELDDPTSTKNRSNTGPLAIFSSVWPMPMAQLPAAAMTTPTRRNLPPCSASCSAPVLLRIWIAGQRRHGGTGKAASTRPRAAFPDARIRP
jgi:hypothetical protein